MLCLLTIRSPSTRALGLVQLRSSDLGLKHLQLMTEEKSLDLLLALRPRPQRDELEQAPQRPVEERQN